MKRVIFHSIFLAYFLVSCSHLSKSRKPAANELKMGCIAMGRAFSDEDLLKPPLKYDELPKRSLAEVSEIKEYKNLAKLNFHHDNQKKTYYIISLLREKYPGSSVDEILERYKKLFTECS